MEERTYFKERQNIIVIGGGIIGCTTAYYLTHHPQFDPSIHSVTLIEASKLANAASGKAGGLLAAWSYPNNLAKLSFDLHDQLAQEHNGEEVWGYRRVRCGQLTAEAPLEKDTHPIESGNRGAIDLGKYWPRETNSSSLLPNDLDWFDKNSSKSYEEFADTSSTAQVHPFQFTNTIAGLAEKKGARIILGRVEHINCSDVDGGFENASPLTSSDDLTKKMVVSVTYLDKTTSLQHTLQASTVVLAAGPWTPTLLPKIRIQPLRAHSVTIKLQRPVSAFCLFSDIHLGAGKKPISLEIYPRPNDEVYICSQGDLNIPLPPPGNAAEVSSVLDIGASNDPLVGNTDLAGLVLATGHSCWGISNAPGTGKAVSELIFDGKISCIDAANLDPKRMR